MSLFNEPGPETRSKLEVTHRAVSPSWFVWATVQREGVKETRTVLIRDRVIDRNRDISIPWDAARELGAVIASALDGARTEDSIWFRDMGQGR